ncbi:unnamed protein product [Musa acuminata var. zebrina]
MASQMDANTVASVEHSSSLSLSLSHTHTQLSLAYLGLQLVDLSSATLMEVQNLYKNTETEKKRHTVYTQQKE